MQTTPIFIENLISGIQASIWVILILLSLYGWKWIPEIVPYIKNMPAIVAFVLIAIWYLLGIIVERIAIYIFFFGEPCLRKIKNIVTEECVCIKRIEEKVQDLLKKAERKVQEDKDWIKLCEEGTQSQRLDAKFGMKAYTPKSYV